MWFSLSDQTVYFLCSIVFGAALAVLYDLVRATRMLVKAGRVHVIISDIVFFTLCGVLTSLFALPFNKGSVRGFIVFGEGIGFLTYRLTIGSVMGRVYSALARLLRRIIKAICEKIKKLFDLLLKAIAFLVYNVAVIIDKSLNIVSGGAKQLIAENIDRRKKRKIKRHEFKVQLAQKRLREAGRRRSHGRERRRSS